jgi:exopolyphosphatase / guanosine-5'-triphosphate,3'-diphosphate pyrophosphatase
VRYAGRMIGEEAARARILLDEERAEQAIRIGLALRVGIAASGGVAALLRRTSLRLEGERLSLHLPGKAAALEGEQMERRLEALAEAFGRRASVAKSGAR